MIQSKLNTFLSKNFPHLSYKIDPPLKETGMIYIDFYKKNLLLGNHKNHFFTIGYKDGVGFFHDEPKNTEKTNYCEMFKYSGVSQENILTIIQTWDSQTS